MKHMQKLITIFVVAIIALVMEFGFHHPLWAQILITLTGAILAFSMFIEMIKTLMSGRYGVDLLAITAIIATLAVGQYWAAMIILLMLVGGDTLEDHAAHKADSDLKSLLENSPQVAHRLDHENNNTSDIEIDDIQVGDWLLVKAREIVPADGHVLKGSSFFDESSLTGEAKPVEKGLGDDVMSGSLNGDSVIVIRADKESKDSQYQRLISLVRESEAKPAHFVRMADRYAVPFTLIAYIIAGVAWFISKDPVRFAEVLVVASPCPLILAAPVALVAGMSRSSRNGIIVKTGDVLEKLATARTFAFDKTGTITQGTLSVDNIVPADGIDKQELLELAASVENNSNHILGRSLVSYAKGQHLPLKNASSVKEVTGNGIQAEVEHKLIKVGKSTYVTGSTSEIEQTQTAIFISIKDKYAGHMTFTDRMRPEAKQTMQVLTQEHQARVMMLTGDQQETAEKIAQQAGISEIHAELLPDEKIKLIENAPKDDRPVVMVGDGVNDAPALAEADVGIAMGAHGATAASETASAVILKDDLSRVEKAVEISEDTMKVARQSVMIGIAICTVLMLIASLGVLPTLFGALLQEVVDTVSILWALRARHGH